MIEETNLSPDSLLCPVGHSLHSGGLAQLARASALQAEGQRFDSVILHFWKEHIDMMEASLSGLPDR